MNETVQKYIDIARKDVAGIPEDMLDIYDALLDNQSKELQRIEEQTSTKNIDRIATVFLPAIKKLARDSIIGKIVGVQPIPDRVAILQMLDYVYTNAHTTDPMFSSTADQVEIGDSVVDHPTTDYSLGPPEGQNITQGIDFIVREIGVKAIQRKLAGKWTFEAQDSSSKMGINLETQITKALAAKIVEEVNFEVLNDLYNGATGATTTWTKPGASDAPAVKERKEKELYFQIIEVATEIYNLTRRYPNYVVCSPRTGAYFRRTGEYVSYTDGKNHQPQISKRLIVSGTLNDEFDIHIMPNLNTEDILVGYKGPSEMESGYIYAPYIPMIIMDSFYNVENWSWIRSVGSFYAKQMVMPKLYGKVQVLTP